MRALAVLPDGTIATGSRDKTVKLWASAGVGFEEKATLVRQGENRGSATGGSVIMCLIVSPSPPPPPPLSLSQVGHTDYVTALTVTPDGRLVSGEGEGKKEGGKGGGRGGRVRSTLPSLPLSLPGSRDKTAILWDAAAAEPALRLAGAHKHALAGVAVAEGGH